MAGNKSLIMIYVELMNTSNQEPHGNPPARYEKIATSVPVHLIGLAVQVDNKVAYWDERELSELQHFSDHIARLSAGRPEIVLHKILE